LAGAESSFLKRLGAQLVPTYVNFVTEQHWGLRRWRLGAKLAHSTFKKLPCEVCSENKALFPNLLEL
jgi:hypothetical protein